MDRPSSRDRSDRSATKRSIQQSPVNRLVHSEHSPVIPGPGNTGTGTGTRYPVPDYTGYTGYTGSDQVQPVTPRHRSHREHNPHWAILSLACYCRIDPLGLNQNARWTDLLLVTGLTGQLRKGQFSSHLSTDQCTLNIHRSHRDPVIPVPVRPVPGTGTRYPVPGNTRYTGSDQAQPVRKLKRYRPISAWTSTSYLFLIYRSDRYN